MLFIKPSQLCLTHLPNISRISGTDGKFGPIQSEHSVRLAPLRAADSSGPRISVVIPVDRGFINCCRDRPPRRSECCGTARRQFPTGTALSFPSTGHSNPTKPYTFLHFSPFGPS